MHGRVSFPWIGGDLYCGKFIRGGLVDVGAAELYRKIFCYWRCFALTSLAILGLFPVPPGQQCTSTSSLWAQRRIVNIRDI